MIIGQIVGAKNLELDLPTLVDTRLLIQANFGGGKSWLLRLVAFGQPGIVHFHSDQVRTTHPRPDLVMACITRICWA
jgi:hypothetical protein